MVISRCIMLLALTVLAYLLYTTVLAAEQPKDNGDQVSNDATIIIPDTQDTYQSGPASAQPPDNVGKFTNKINYERFEGEGEQEESAPPAEPTPNEPQNNETPQEVTPAENTDITYDPEDVVKVEGTDLLVAPIADRYQAVNSIANVNRNASNDLRGDIAIPYDENYTPFYQSAIVGEPLHSNPLQ